MECDISIEPLETSAKQPCRRPIKVHSRASVLTMQAGPGAAQEAGNIIQDGVRVALVLYSIAIFNIHPLASSLRLLSKVCSQDCRSLGPLDWVMCTQD